jgi:hypothetical protein
MNAVVAMGVYAGRWVIIEGLAVDVMLGIE